VKLQFSIRAYALAVVFVAEIVSLCKLIPWAIRIYHPSAFMLPAGHRGARGVSCEL
jgi:hypothetical protein